MRFIGTVIAAVALSIIGIAGPASAGTAVPGHEGRDGVVVSHYTQDQSYMTTTGLWSLATTSSTPGVTSV